MKYIHLNCLRLWVNQRIEIKNYANSTIITWKSLACELCKTPYPFAVYFNTKIHELLNYQLPQPPYAIFECYSKDSIDSNGLCIITFASKNILKMGRHADNDVVINDVSISRRQAILQWNAQSLFIADAGSKFGTLTLLRQPKIVGPKLEVQCGKSLIEFDIKKSWSFFGCCGSVGKSKMLTEETKMFPEDCLPGEGKHSILVITKREYNKLLRPADRIKKIKTSPFKTMYKALNKDAITGIRSYIRSKKALNKKVTSICELRYDSTALIKLRGDNTDGIDDCDCQ